MTTENLLEPVFHPVFQPVFRDHEPEPDWAMWGEDVDAALGDDPYTKHGDD